MWWYEDSLVDLDPWNLLFRNNLKCSLLDIGPSICVDTYFTKYPNDPGMPIERKMILFEGHM